MTAVANKQNPILAGVFTVAAYTALLGGVVAWLWLKEWRWAATGMCACFVLAVASTAAAPHDNGTTQEDTDDDWP